MPNITTNHTITKLIYDFICEIRNLSWQRSARLQGLKGYEQRCQGIKRRRFRKGKHTKKHIKNDSNRKIRKVLNFRFMLQAFLYLKFSIR